MGDTAVIHDVEGQNGFSFGEVKKVAVFSDAAFWRKIGIVLVLNSLSVGDLIGAALAILGLFC